MTNSAAGNIHAAIAATAAVQKLRRELADVAPDLEALVKVREQRELADAAEAASNSQMQTVGVMSDQFTGLIKRSEQLGADLEDAMTAAIMVCFCECTCMPREDSLKDKFPGACVPTVTSSCFGANEDTRTAASTFAL